MLTLAWLIHQNSNIVFCRYQISNARYILHVIDSHSCVAITYTCLNLTVHQSLHLFNVYHSNNMLKIFLHTITCENKICKLTKTLITFVFCTHATKTLNLLFCCFVQTWQHTTAEITCLCFLLPAILFYIQNHH